MIRPLKWLLFMVIALLPLTTLCGRTYRIATVAWIGWSPLHVAAEKGFWNTQGIDVSVISYDDPIVILEAIKAGKIDFAMDMAGSLVGIYMEGEAVVAIAETNWSHGGDKIIVKQGHSLEAHRGDVIGVFLHQPSCLYFLNRYLEQRKLHLSDFRVVEINPRDLSAQFIAGRLPAIVNYDPWATLAVRDGNGEILATSADFEGSIPECLWAYRQTLEETPDNDIHRILRGWIRAVRWMKNPAHQTEYLQILKHTTFAQETALTPADLTAMMSEVRIHDPEAMIERNRRGGGLDSYLDSVEAFLRENHLLKRDVSPQELFDNRYIMHVLNRHQSDDS